MKQSQCTCNFLILFRFLDVVFVPSSRYNGCKLREERREMKNTILYIVYGLQDFALSESQGAFTSREKADACIADLELTQGEMIQDVWYPRFEEYSVISEEVQ